MILLGDIIVDIKGDRGDFINLKIMLHSRHRKKGSRIPPCRSAKPKTHKFTNLLSISAARYPLPWEIWSLGDVGNASGATPPAVRGCYVVLCTQDTSCGSRYTCVPHAGRRDPRCQSQAGPEMAPRQAADEDSLAMDETKARLHQIREAYKVIMSDTSKRAMYDAGLHLIDG